MTPIHLRSKFSMHEGMYYYDNNLVCSANMTGGIYCGHRIREGARIFSTQKIINPGISDSDWVCFCLAYRKDPDSVGFVLEFPNSGKVFSGSREDREGATFAVRAVVENNNSEADVWVAFGGYREFDLFSNRGFSVTGIRNFDAKFNFFQKESAAAILSLVEEKEKKPEFRNAAVKQQRASNTTQFAQVLHGIFQSTHIQATPPHVYMPTLRKNANLLDLRTGKMHFSSTVEDLQAFGADFVVRQRGMYNLYSPSEGFKSPIWFTDIIAVQSNGPPSGIVGSAKEIWFVTGNKFVRVFKNKKFSLNDGGELPDVEPFRNVSIV